MSLTTALFAGASGLKAASAGIAATSHNVSNATTPGFSRRRVEQTTALPQEGRLVMGTGVDVRGFERVSSDRLVEQQVDAQADLTHSQTREQALAPLETYFDPSLGSGPRQATAQFFDALSAATRDPADPGLRLEVIASAETVARSFQTSGKGLTTTIASETRRLEAGVADLNSLMGEVAEVNRSIIKGGGPLRSGDMMDRRDQLMRQAGELAGVELDIQPDGTATGRLGGHVIVSGTEPREVRLGPDGVSVAVGGGSVNVENRLGGELGGRWDAVEFAQGLQDDLNVLAENFAVAVNDAHALGFDATGAAGGAMFDFAPGSAATTLTVSTDVGSDPDALAFAANASALAGDGGNLQNLMDVEFVAVSGTDDTATGLSALSSRIGGSIRASQAETAQAEAISLDLDELQNNISGVDLDEEAVNLMTFQSAYAAAAKVVQTSDAMMATLMEMV